MKVWTGKSLEAYDVIVVGSGAIGLTGALAAATTGAEVLVLEKGPYLGGTAAISGGMVWIPLNRYATEIGLDDDRDDALRYLRRVSDGRTDEAVLEAFVDGGDAMLGFVAEHAGLRFRSMARFPDYHPEWDGASSGGRSLEPELWDATVLGDLAESLRPDARPPFTMQEYEDWRIFTRFPWSDLEARGAQGLVARGRALVAPLIAACAREGVTLVTGCGAERLVHGEDGVTGVVSTDGAAITARAGVILACGGFEWSPEMVGSFLPGPVSGACSPPHNTGDGIRMASKAGARIGNMNEAWWGPMVNIPGDETDGHQTSTLLRFERTGPRSIIVNRAGRRFVNEAHNYNDMTKAFHVFDPRAYTYANLPAYLIFDQAHLDAYGFLAHRAGQPTPDWLTTGPTLAALAQRLGVDAAGLDATVAAFNAHAEQGEDPDFHRGESAYDRYWGDDQAAHPALGPVATAPFYAIEVFSGVIGTKGGLVTDPDGRALDSFGDVIPGLYAAGNTTAQLMGPGYAGAGSTLGPGSVMAFLAARACCVART